MKVTLALIGLLAMSAVTLFLTQGQVPVENVQDNKMEKYAEAWEQWLATFAPAQKFRGSQGVFRFTNFVDNMEQIEKYNQEHPETVLKINQFGDLTSEEFQAQYLLQTRPERPENVKTTKATKKASDLPQSINWYEKGAVYETQNQGQCGSCWAFATIGGLQGLRYLNDGVLELLSAQQVTSCVPAEYLDDKTQGCGGGEARYAYQYTAENGIETWEDYPYVNFEGGVAAPCAYDKSKVVFQNQGVGFVEKNNVQAMKENLVRQPLSIAVDASSLVFQFYSDGIIKGNCNTELNHAILLVGYDLSGETPYWTVQNSWGTTWGQNGFGNIAITEGDGVCGINMQVDYPSAVSQSLFE